LWPRLAGFSAWFGLDDSGEPASGALVLHFRDPGTAESFASRLAPRLCRWLGARHEGPGPQERAEDSVHFDRAAADDTGTVVASLRDRPVGVLLHRASLAITWGDDALPATRVSWRRASPELPGGLSTALHAGQYQRLGAIWPGRFTRGAKGLLRLSVDTAPLVWTGSADGQSLEDRVEWANLSETVKSVVDALPRLPDPEPGR
jgi:hypothetical protein